MTSDWKEEREVTTYAQGMTLSTAMLFPFVGGPLRAESGKWQRLESKSGQGDRLLEVFEAMSFHRKG